MSSFWLWLPESNGCQPHVFSFRSRYLNIQGNEGHCHVCFSALNFSNTINGSLPLCPDSFSEVSKKKKARRHARCFHNQNAYDLCLSFCSRLSKNENQQHHVWASSLGLRNFNICFLFGVVLLTTILSTFFFPSQLKYKEGMDNVRLFCSRLFKYQTPQSRCLKLFSGSLKY